MSQARNECLRCKKVWYTDEPEVDPLCPICEALYEQQQADERASAADAAVEADARATAGFCPRRHHGHTTEWVGNELIIYPHEPVLLPDGSPERALLPGDVFVCRFCRALYWPETSSEWAARLDRGG